MIIVRLILAILIVSSPAFVHNINSAPSPLKDVHIEITKAAQQPALLHWKITNDLETAIYVYDFYLWGPAYHLERADDHLIIETTPVAEEASCPPNRFPPVLLLVVGPHRSIEGDFADSEIKDLGNKSIRMRIAVGSEPNTVVAEAKKFMVSRCTHNPYDAVVRWGTILDSNDIRLSSVPAAKAESNTSLASLCEVATKCDEFDGKRVRFRASFISDGLEHSNLMDPNCVLGIEPYTSEEVDDHSDLKALDSALAQGRPGTLDKEIVATFTGRYSCQSSTSSNQRRILHIEAVEDLRVTIHRETLRPRCLYQSSKDWCIYPRKSTTVM